MKERFSMHFNLACLILYVPTWELKRVHLGSACAWYCVYLSSLTTDPWGSESNPCVDDQEGYHCASIHCPQRALIFALYNSYGLVVIPFRVRNNKKHPYTLVITYLPTYLPTNVCEIIDGSFQPVFLKLIQTCSNPLAITGLVDSKLVKLNATQAGNILGRKASHANTHWRLINFYKFQIDFLCVPSPASFSNKHYNPFLLTI